MKLYGQEPEVQLLASFVSRLEQRSIIDVGAERGSFAEEMLRGGSDDVHLIEPEPRNAAFLRAHFRDDPRVTVHQCAASESDAQLHLRISVSPDGTPVSYGHTVLDRPDTDEIAWLEPVTVSARSLASLIADGAVPARVGILKVDTEGHDFSVVAGMGPLDCDVVMVEHWSDLPRSLGPCPWTAKEMASALRRRGFSHFAFVVHRGEFTVLQWDDGRVPRGHMGNLIFFHDRALADLLPAVLDCASWLARNVVDMSEALGRERDLQAEAADERLRTIEALNRELELQAASASERLVALEDLTAECDLLAKAADERLKTIEELVRNANSGWARPKSR